MNSTNADIDTGSDVYLVVSDGAERVEFVEEDDARSGVTSAHEHLPHSALALTHVHVEQLRTLHRYEVQAGLVGDSLNSHDIALQYLMLNTEQSNAIRIKTRV